MKIFKLTIFSLMVVVAVGIISHISNAEINPEHEVKIRNFSVIGTVLSINESRIALSDAQDSEGTKDLSIDLDISNVQKIEDTNYNPLTVTDIKEGEMVIVQAIEKDGVVSVNRIISFATKSNQPVIETPVVDVPEQEVATTTATTTEEIITPDSTSISTSTSTSTPTSTTTSEGIE